MAPKRKRTKEEDYEVIAKKIKKLERKLMRAKKKHNSSSSLDSEVSEGHVEDETAQYDSLEYNEGHSQSEQIDPQNDELFEPYPELAMDSLPVLESIDPQPGPSNATVSQEPQSNNSETINCESDQPPKDDGVILELLGDDPSVRKEYAKDIHLDLASRLQHIAVTGLPKEVRKALLDKYLPPNNCQLVDSPELNLEIKAAIAPAIYKRDKVIEVKQNQLGSAISSIAATLTILLQEEQKNKEIIKELMDTCRLLCDLQYSDSVTRRHFVLYNLKKELKEQLQNTKIDRFLFGKDLSETLKVAKSINRSVADLKYAPSFPTTKPKAPTTIPPRNLNWKGPPLNRRPGGPQRMKEPAPRPQCGNFSRPSYRPPAPNTAPQGHRHR